MHRLGGVIGTLDNCKVGTRYGHRSLWICIANLDDGIQLCRQSLNDVSVPRGTVTVGVEAGWANPRHMTS